MPHLTSRRRARAVAWAGASLVLASLLAKFGGVTVTESARAPAPVGAILLALETVVLLLLLRAETMGADRRRRMATLRMRPLRARTALLLAPVPVLMYLTSAGYVIARGGLGGPGAVEPGATFQVTVGAVWSRALLVPIVEEFLLRGWAQRSLERALGATPAVVIVALTFAALHGAAAGFPWHILAAGLALGIVARVTRSIWACVLVHAGNNALALLLPTQFPRWGIPDTAALAHWMTLESTRHAAAAVAIGAGALLTAAIFHLSREARTPWPVARRSGS